MASQLTVDNIVGATTAANVHIPGAVVQVQNTEYQTSTSIASSSGSHVGITGLSVNITPKYNNSKIWIQVRWCGEYDFNGAWNSMWGITRNGTLLGRTSTDAGSGAYGLAPPTTSYGGGNDNSSTMEAAVYGYYDSPATTSAITYQATLMAISSYTLYINRTVSGSGDEYGTSSITAWEIAQ